MQFEIKSTRQDLKFQIQMEEIGKRSCVCKSMVHWEMARAQRGHRRRIRGDETKCGVRKGV